MKHKIDCMANNDCHGHLGCTCGADYLNALEQKETSSEYLGQKYLPIALTIGDLKKQIADLPDDMDFGFCNQPRQQIAIREHTNYKCAVFNGLEND